MTILYYRLEADREPGPSPTPPQDGATTLVWEASGGAEPPVALADRTLRIWRWFDRLGLFVSRRFAVVALMRQDRLLHRLFITPRWYRFPFMAKRDLQIGGLWTAETERGRGYASVAIGAAHDHLAKDRPTLWYVVEDTNMTSRRLIERFGYTLAAKGRRTAPLGLSPIGRFVIDEWLV